MGAEIFVEGVEVAASVWQHRTALRQALTRLWNRLRHGHMCLAAFGLGGVGKTTLGHLLTGDTEADDLSPAYSESLVAERYALEGELVCSLLVPPGQERRLEERPQVELRRRIAAGDAVGVINVVSYGYHSFAEIGFERHKLYQPGMSPEEFLKVYIAARRRDEMRALEALKPYLTAAPSRVWMLTLVTKQDLWWAERREVSEHYSAGEYQAQIDDITRQRGVQNFTHRVVSASLVWNNFRDGEGKVLATTTAGYEQSVRAANLKRSLTTIHDLLEQEVKR
jgi:hypothetical protein